MRFAVPLLVAAILGLAAGVGSALLMAGQLPVGSHIGDSVNIDNWRSDWSIGSEAADPYVRARIARHGLLALRKEEAVYFTRAVDDDGKALKESCAYRVTGGAFPAEWWSITLYDSESRLPMNEDGALSFDATDAAELGSPEAWSFMVGADAGGIDPRRWVSSKGAGKFDLMIRLYLPSDALLVSPESELTPPSIEQVACGGKA